MIVLLINIFCFIYIYLSMKLPNIPAKLFSLSAVTIGYLLIDDLTANEQNALGNWLMLIAQVLCTNAFYKQVQTERLSDEDTINMLNKMINTMNKGVDNINTEFFHK